MPGAQNHRISPASGLTASNSSTVRPTGFLASATISGVKCSIPYLPEMFATPSSFRPFCSALHDA